jgi:hypothetical protein
MSGHGHGYDRVNDHPSLAGWGSGFALGYNLPPGAPRRRCACRGITVEADTLTWAVSSTKFLTLRGRGGTGRRARFRFWW